MYDEDNSREIDIHEMERVMKVSNAAKLSIFRLFWNQCERTIGDGTSEPWNYFIYCVMWDFGEYLAKFGSNKNSGQQKFSF